MLLSDKPQFSRLSASRQALVRLCQSTNYGYIHELLIKDKEPVFDPGPVLLLDIKLDSEERPRDEFASADFLLGAELVRMMALLDQIQNGKISKLEVRAGVPRRILLERRTWRGAAAACRSFPSGGAGVRKRIRHGFRKGPESAGSSERMCISNRRSAVKSPAKWQAQSSSQSACIRCRGDYTSKVCWRASTRGEECFLVRRILGGHPRTVLHLKASDLLGLATESAQKPS